MPALVAVLLMAWAPTLSAQAATVEGRIKLDLDVQLLRARAEGFSPTLRPMLRTEQRFRGQGLVLFKVFAGLRADVTPWLMLQSYYAHKDLFYDEHKQVHMLVLDLVFHVRAGPVVFKGRNGHEWHSDPGFYRSRHYLELLVRPPGAVLGGWISDELRFDSDQDRLNLNDLCVGVELHPLAALSVRVYYDLEANRRKSGDWEATHVAATKLSMRL